MNKIALQRRWLLSILIALALVSGVVQANTLTGVRALIYSTSAAELQWTRAASERVQVTYNGQSLGVFDANSLYRSSLRTDITHRFEVRTLNGSGALSEPQILTFTTGDFTPPTKQVVADSGSSSSQNGSVAASGTDISGGISSVRALVYSRTAAELVWNRDGATRVEIYYNNQPQGTLDATSYFVGNLDPSTPHHFELVAVNQNGESAGSYEVSFSTQDFSGQSYTVTATSGGTSVAASGNQNTETQPANSAPSTDRVVVNNEPVPAPAAPAPAPQPEPEPEPPTQVAQSNPSQPINAGDCVVRSIANLNSCVNAAAGFSRINIQNDLACTGSACCPSGGALLELNNVSNLSIEGNGHRLLRQDGQRQCSLVDVQNSSRLAINNWKLDDDSRDAACVVNDRCPRMLHIRNSSNITLNGISVSNSKGYAIYVQRVNGFSFDNSELRNSGVLGLYIGHESDSSTNISVRNSTFLDNQTNALALLGVTGSSAGTNVVSNNVFRRNHWRGQWPVAARFGTGFTGGGQIYVARATGVTISGNTVADGRCVNCFVRSDGGTGISGIEIAKPGENSVSNVRITNNTISNNDSWGIFVNEGSSVNSSVVISNNRLIGNLRALKVSGAAVSGNTIQ